jgi:hypothetical protein
MTQSTTNMTAQETEDYLKSIQIPQFNIGNWTDEPCFYVSVVDGAKYAFILGPFRTEAECREYAYLETVDGGDRGKHLAMIHKANELDPKAAFYGFGMCKAPNGHRSGVMNKYFGL